MTYIVSDLLLNSLHTCAALLIAVAGCACGTATGLALDGRMMSMVWGAGIGFSVGLIAGLAGLTVIGSGVKTILVCWAEDPDKLAETQPDIHEEFRSRIAQGFE